MGPTFPFNIKKEIIKYVNINNKKLKCLDIGSGNLILNEKLINLDFRPYKKVDVIGMQKIYFLKINL
jgi:hypothetical protein